MNADFVAEDRTDAIGLHDRAARDQEPPSRNQQPGGKIVPHLHERFEALVALGICGDHLARPHFDEMAVGTAFGGCLRVRGDLLAAGEDLFGCAEEVRLDGTVQCTAELDELPRFTGGEHRQLQIDFLLLFTVELVEHRVFEVIEGDREQRLLCGFDLDDQRPIEETRRAREIACREFAPGGFRIYRRNGEKKIEAGGDVVDAAVGALHGIDECLSAERAMGREFEAARRSREGSEGVQGGIEDARDQPLAHFREDPAGIVLPVDGCETNPH